MKGSKARRSFETAFICLNWLATHTICNYNVNEFFDWNKRKKSIYHQKSKSNVVARFVWNWKQGKLVSIIPKFLNWDSGCQIPQQKKEKSNYCAFQSYFKKLCCVVVVALVYCIQLAFIFVWKLAHFRLYFDSIAINCIQTQIQWNIYSIDNFYQLIGISIPYKFFVSFFFRLTISST